MRGLILTLTGSLSLLALSTCLAQAATGSAPVVKVETGILEGVDRGGVRAFLGVPFAAPPTGLNRWRAPQPLAPWNGVRRATTFGASCMQPYPPTTFGPYTREFVDTPHIAEDCLFLNVWSPAKTSAQLPVLVWIHGGAFLGGSGAVPIQDGASLAAKGAVVVTINYRVGAFGFLAHPALSAESDQRTSGNYGLLDQIAALRWVRRNITAFGGDPLKVTIAGQSAGAASVNDLLLAPAARGLFQRAASQSGAGMGVGGSTLAQAEKNGLEFGASLGANSLAALRALPAERIQAATFLPLAAASNSGPPPIRFQPVIDGKILLADPDRPDATPVSRVPLIAGFTRDEALDIAPTPATDFMRNVRERYGTSAERLLTLYPHATDAEAAESARLLARDRYMASLILWSEARIKKAVPSIYLYRFDHAVPVAAPPSYGAFHTAEVPYLFGVLDTAARPYTDADRKVSALVQGYWLNFMRTGDPNGPGLPRWERAAAGGTQVMSLGTAPGARPAVSTPERLEGLRDYVTRGGTLGLF